MLGLTEKTKVDVSDLPEKAQVDVSGLPENIQEDGSEAFPVVILDRGACLIKKFTILQVTEGDLESFDPKECLNNTVISYVIREFIGAHSSTYNFYYLAVSSWPTRQTSAIWQRPMRLSAG
ncbi:unnamed protein product [Phytophthora fragariaefolia]|uniref:Unnamed protein product n=1 Tax=Phytophthora fragariaefolia TaxID=1490495 RepID=A0A9W6XAK6_9STRA|nr:unnamed protein product [Phytophthora fragariaefolia]